MRLLHAQFRHIGRLGACQVGAAQSALRLPAVLSSMPCPLCHPAYACPLSTPRLPAVPRQVLIEKWSAFAPEFKELSSNE